MEDFALKAAWSSDEDKLEIQAMGAPRYHQPFAFFGSSVGQ